MDLSKCENYSIGEFASFDIEDLCERLSSMNDSVTLALRDADENLFRTLSTACYPNGTAYNLTFFDRCVLANLMTVHGLISSVFNASSSSDSDATSDSNYTLSFWAVMFWSIVFGVMVVVATGGNLIVIWIVLSHQRMRSVTNYFLVNLSVADTMVSTLNVIFNFYFMISGYWPFGDAYCKFSNFVAILSVAASVFTMMAISIDRFIAIMFPLRPRMSKMSTLVITFIIWLGSSFLSLPNVLYSSNVVYVNDKEVHSICFWVWPDGHTGDSYQEHIYNVLIFVLTYVLPMCAIAFCYMKISRELWGSKSIGESTARQVESVKNKRKVVKMMILVVIIFAICWLPYHIYFIIIYYEPGIVKFKNIQHYFLLIYWLAMSNSMYNPIIYCWMNSRFREGFKTVFSCFPCVKLTENSLSNHKLHYNCGGGSRNENRNVRYSCSHSADGLVHISLHTLTDVVNLDNETASTNLTMVNSTLNNTSIRKCSRHKMLPAIFIRKIRTKKPSAV